MLSPLKSGSVALGRLWSAPAPERPIVVIHSDDWGRTGAPSPGSIAKLQALGLPVGDSPWDHYGLETEEDVLALGGILAELRDRGGRSACATVNFIMANPDLRTMRDEGFRAFRWVAIKDGFPEPWQDRLMPAYRQCIDMGVFYPGLHGFTHFNPAELLRALAEDSPYGERARALATHDIPYLATVTPEFNFALVTRRGAEHFIAEEGQAEWVALGAQLFGETFGMAPRTTCAPGYRANDTTFRVWRQAGIEAAQTVGDDPVARRNGMLVLSRNVRFEPVLDDEATEARALRQARRTVARGMPIVVCSHSINYIERHLGRAGTSRLRLQRFLRSLLDLFPDLRFASDADILDAYHGRTPGWLRPPNTSEIVQRLSSWIRRGRGHQAS
jgi:hypothetical protein